MNMIEDKGVIKFNHTKSNAPLSIYFKYVTRGVVTKLVSATIILKDGRKIIKNFSGGVI